MKTLVVACFPWLGLKEAVSAGDVRFLPFNAEIAKTSADLGNLAPSLTTLKCLPPRTRALRIARTVSDRLNSCSPMLLTSKQSGTQWHPPPKTGGQRGSHFPRCRLYVRVHCSIDALGSIYRALLAFVGRQCGHQLFVR